MNTRTAIRAKLRASDKPSINSSGRRRRRAGNDRSIDKYSGVKSYEASYGRGVARGLVYR